MQARRKLPPPEGQVVSGVGPLGERDGADVVKGAEQLRGEGHVGRVPVPLLMRGGGQRRVGELGFE